jgi:hypothetical protein
MCHQIECGCGYHARIPASGWHHWGWYCGTGYTSQRFPTKQGSIEEPEQYLKQLKAEAKGVEERLGKLSKES